MNSKIYQIINLQKLYKQDNLTNKIILLEAKMERTEITSMSSKGQIVIPQALREKLKLKEGERFVIFGQEDTIILKKMSLPTFADFDKMIEIARQRAKENNLTPKDAELAIKRARNENNTRY